MNIIWAITGAGHLLKESTETLDKLSDKHNITLALSKAGEEVITLYGLNKKIEEIINKKTSNKIVQEDEQKYSYPFSGKITHEKYDLIIIAPATANTIAKIVHGIADTLVTNIAAQSGKGEIPLIILPVDQKEGPVESILPPYIDKKKCIKCEDCIPKRICPEEAITPPEIDSRKCRGCKKCENKCKYDAIILNKKIKLYIRKIDAQNTEKLDEIENITRVKLPEDIIKKIDKIR